MNVRIKEVRIHNCMTQQEFADKLGINRSNIANYESGTRTPVDAVVSLICRTFGVSESWLRTGEGEMFVPMTREEEIAQLVGDVIGGDNEFQKALVRFICRRTPQQLAEIEKMITELIKEIDNK